MTNYKLRVLLYLSFCKDQNKDTTVLSKTYVFTFCPLGLQRLDGINLQELEYDSYRHIFRAWANIDYTDYDTYTLTLDNFIKRKHYNREEEYTTKVIKYSQK